MTPVFYYHRVGPFRDGAPRKLTVTPENFRRQVALLASSGLELLTLDGVLEGRRGVAVTFDDGFLDCMTHALPVLREYRCPAAFFIVAGSPGGLDDWNRNTPFPREKVMGWDDLRRLLDAGMTIGSHSLTHETLTREEVVESKRLLEDRLGIKVEHFAYPRGEVAPEAPGWVREAGYKAGWATKGGSDDPFLRKRLPVSASLSPLGFRFKLLKARWGRYR